jgi:diguanylate cyclase (GGDEF)-like protein/PAS domain S-box-containing protein
MNDYTDESYLYKFVIENIKDIIWELDSNLVYTFISKSCKEATGYEPEEMIRTCMLNYLTPESKEYIAQKYRDRMKSGEDIRKSNLYDVQFICKDGTIIWFEVSAKPVIKDNGIAGYIGVSRDVSVKKAYEEEMKRYIDELQQANTKLDNLATFDLLTGAYNRRKFVFFVELSIEKKVKYTSPFSIIMFDIDFFKRVNDNFGHKTGDRILQEITAIVKHKLRESDKIFRWGGEEFIILLPETPLKNAFNVAEKVRKSIEHYDFGIDHNVVTISLGVGEYILNDNIDQFVSRVDNALLRAKSNGRNRTELC